MRRVLFGFFIVALLVVSQRPPVASADAVSICSGTGPNAAIAAACSALIATGRLDKQSLEAAYINRGAAYDNLGHHNKAVADYTSAIAIAPSAQAYFGRAVAYENLGRDANAVSDYTQAIALQPNFPEAFVRRGYAYLRAFGYPEALRDFNAALALNPSTPFALDGRGLAYQGMGNYAAAIADFTAVIAATPTYEAYRDRARTQFYMGHFADAAQDFAHTVTLKPGDVYPLLWQHIALLRAGQVDATFATATASVNQQTWPGALIPLFLQKSTPEAVFAAADGSGQQCEAEFYVAEWYKTQNQIPYAVLDFTQASQMCPRGTFEYQAALSELQR